MRVELLRSAVHAQAEKRPVVLLRNLDSDERWLLDPSATTDDLEHVSDSVLTRCYEALKRDGASVFESDGQRYLLQTISPPYRLLVIGAVHIAQALIPMARSAGYAVTLIDPRPAFATPQRFPETEILTAWPQDVMDELSLSSRTAVVTLSHDPKIDEPALAAALRSDAFYIGALGSKKNHAGRLERLSELGFEPATLERIAGPVGLNLGGRAPAEIAVAILAQIIQSRYGSDAHER